MTDAKGMSRHKAEVLLYRTGDGRTRVEVRFDGETAWLSLGQLAELFQRDKSVISRHIKNIFDNGELSRGATVAEYATVQREGGREEGELVEEATCKTFLQVRREGRRRIEKAQETIKTWDLVLKSKRDWDRRRNEHETR